MTLSRHTQVEDLASLLAIRRTRLWERALRQQAYLNLTTAVLDLPDLRGLSALLAGPSDPLREWSSNVRQ